MSVNLSRDSSTSLNLHLWKSTLASSCWVSGCWAVLRIKCNYAHQKSNNGRYWTCSCKFVLFIYTPSNLIHFFQICALHWVLMLPSMQPVSCPLHFLLLVRLKPHRLPLTVLGVSWTQRRVRWLYMAVGAAAHITVYSSCLKHSRKLQLNRKWFRHGLTELLEQVLAGSGGKVGAKPDLTGKEGQLNSHQ